MLARYKNTLTYEDIQSIAKELDMKITHRKYRMWHQVPFIGETAVVVDEIEIRGGHAIVTNPKRFPPLIDRQFIVDAIRNDAISLGKIQLKDYRYDFSPWYNLIGHYPAGYFTHMI